MDLVLKGLDWVVDGLRTATDPWKSPETFAVIQIHASKGWSRPPTDAFVPHSSSLVRLVVSAKPQSRKTLFSLCRHSYRSGTASDPNSEQQRFV